MRNFNPIFNSFNMTRSASPFATAGASAASAITKSGGLFSRTAGTKITLSGILNGAQKTIGTVNQIVPLYNQIKPMFNNSKILLNVVRGLKGTNSTTHRTRFNRRQPKINTTPIDINEIQKNQSNETNTKKTNEAGPSKPFFI